MTPYLLHLVKTLIKCVLKQLMRVEWIHFQLLSIARWMVERTSSPPDPCPPSSIIKYQFNTKLPRGDMSLKCKSDDWWWGAFQWPPSWHVTLIKHTLSSLLTNWGFLPRLQSSSASGVFGTNVFPVPVWCEYKLFVSSLTNCPCPRLFCLYSCQGKFVIVFTIF